MPDREKVITEIEDALSGNLAKAGHVYRMSLNGLKDKALKDSLDLLKEQEAVEPIKKEMVEITSRYEFDCPCGAPLLIGQPYCADCGRSVNWNEVS